LEQKLKLFPDLNNKNIDFHDNHFQDLKKWKPEDFKLYIAIAGCFNLVDLKEHFDRKGLYLDVLLHVMENDLYKYSPFYQLLMDFIPNPESSFPKSLQDVELHSRLPYICLSEPINHDHNNSNCSYYDYDPNFNANVWSCSFCETSDLSKQQNHSPHVINHIKNDIDCSTNNCKCAIINNKDDNTKCPLVLCPVYLFHGGSDRSVPVDSATMFAKTLAKYNIETYLKIYPSKTHTGPMIEDPIQGIDPLMCDMLKVIFPNENLDESIKKIENKIRGFIKIPTFIVTFARHICPF